jgi:hypothetical protein
LTWKGTIDSGDHSAIPRFEFSSWFSYKLASVQFADLNAWQRIPIFDISSSHCYILPKPPNLDLQFPPYY